MAKELSDEEKQTALNKAVEAAALSSKKIPEYLDFLVTNLRGKPKELQYWVDKLKKELEGGIMIHWHKAERDAAMERLKPFRKNKQQLSDAGKKGRRTKDTASIAEAQRILREHAEPLRRISINNLMKLLLAHGLNRKRTWVAENKKEILSAITRA
jgi:hypothetical protein